MKLITTMIVFAISWGFVCFKFWVWFILPIFPMLPILTFLQCVGLMFFISLFKPQYSVKDKKDEVVKVKDILSSLILPWIVLCIAWIIKTLFLL